MKKIELKLISNIVIIFFASLLLTGCVQQPTKNNSADPSPSTYDQDQIRSDLEQFCISQEGIEEVAKYERSEGNISLTATYVWDQLSNEYTEPDPLNHKWELPYEWQTKYKEEENTQLVLCVKLLDKTESNSDVCEYEIDDDSLPGFVNLYDAEYEIKLYEARTANLIFEDTVEITQEECPEYWEFESEFSYNENKLPYEKLEKRLKDILADYIAH
ncbi:hypothetical protein GF362_03155 [Candidatus Dojkabacteria bacterium]|nr:hypothetical protein [Candidatus Dojkabacteria bacterium]